MADSFTPQLRMVQQTDQANVNIWGNNWNEGVIDLIETAIAGRQDVDVTVASQTLTLANGASDTSRAMFLHIIGNPGVAREVVVPSLQKAYVVSNETSPGFDVEIKTASNSGVTVPSGTRSMVYVDQSADMVVSPITSGDTVSAAELPYASTIFDIDNATAGDTTVTVEFVRQGNFIIARMPAISTTVSVGGNQWTLTPQTSVPADLIPSGPLANEFPLCMEENGTPNGALLTVPPINAAWSFLRADFALWTAASTRVLAYPLKFVMHQVNP